MPAVAGTTLSYAGECSAGTGEEVGRNFGASSPSRKATVHGGESQRENEKWVIPSGSLLVLGKLGAGGIPTGLRPRERRGRRLSRRSIITRAGAYGSDPIPIDRIATSSALGVQCLRALLSSSLQNHPRKQGACTCQTRAMVKLGIFGGTSLLKSDLFSSLEPKTVPTPFGKAIVHVDPTGRKPLVFVQRHHADGDAGADVYRPPHLINFRANIAAMVAEGVERVFAVCSVGSLSAALPIGSVVIPDDYFYLFGPPVSFFDDDRAHIVPGVNADLRAEVLDALQQAGTPGLQSGSAVYVQTVGPRFETKAEVRFLSSLGDVIGMTAASEATMTKENGLPYAMLAMVDNMANGLAGSELTHEQFKANVARNQGTVENAVKVVLDKLLA